MKSSFYKTEIIQLERVIILGEERIKINQLENILKSIIAWEIKSNDIISLDYSKYIDESNISNTAKEARIVEPKEIKIYNTSAWDLKTEYISYTYDAKFQEAVISWNSYIESSKKISNLRDEKTKLEKLELELKEINERINKIYDWKSKEEIRILQNTKEDIKKSIDKVDSRIIAIKDILGYEIWNMWPNELDWRLKNIDTEFKNELIKNPWFNDFLGKNKWLKIDSMSWRGLWELFTKHFKTEVVKKI